MSLIGITNFYAISIIIRIRRQYELKWSSLQTSFHLKSTLIQVKNDKHSN